MSCDVIYVSMLMSERLCAEMTDRGVSYNVAAQTFHELLAEGIAGNDRCGRLTALSGLHYSADKIAFRKNEKRGNVDFVYAGHLNFPVLRTPTRIVCTFAKLIGLCLKRRKNAVLMVDPLLLFLLWPSVICSKLFGIPLFLVVTDLINFMDSSGGERRRNWLKRLNTRLFTRLCGAADGYIVLTRQMCDIINPRRKPFLVMEGLIRHQDGPDGEETAAGAERRSPRIIMYAGGIYRAYGVDLLLKAFIKADLPDAELHLYGWGDMVPEVREICRQHPNIQFKGSVPHREIMAAERDASLLVNPRPGGQEFTKYSFPSKNLEYMASGTPLLAFMLPGIPEEYREYFFVISSDDEAELAAQLSGIMSKSRDDLDAFGARAGKFAADHKNHLAQAERVMSFVEDTIRTEKPGRDGDRARKNRSRKCENLILALIILLAIGLRLAHSRYNLPTRDSIQYVTVAQSVRDSGFWTEFTAQYPPTMPPLLHLYLGTVVKAGGDPYRWGLFLMLLADAVFIFALYRCGKKLFPLYRFAGIYAAVFAATTPELVNVGNSILRDNLYLCFFALALYCGLCMNGAAKIAAKPAVGYGLCCAAGMLCRKEAVELPAIFALWSLWMLIARRRDWKRIIGNALIVLATFVVAFVVTFGILRTCYPAQTVMVKAWSLFIRR